MMDIINIELNWMYCFGWNTCWNFYDEDAQQTNKQTITTTKAMKIKSKKEKEKMIFKENWNLYTVTINKWIIYRHNNKMLWVKFQNWTCTFRVIVIFVLYIFFLVLYLFWFFDDFFSLSLSLSSFYLYVSLTFD